MKYLLIIILSVCSTATYADSSYGPEELDRLIEKRVVARSTADLIEKYPELFDQRFPSDTVEELDQSLKKLKRMLSFVRRENLINNLLLLGSTRDEVNPIFVFKRKIREWKQKRRTLKSVSCKKTFSSV